MSVKIPYLAALPHVDALVAALFDGALLHLYKNDYTPVNGSVLGDFTEANFTGYAYIVMDSWSPAFLNADNKGESDDDQRTFTMTGTGTTNTVYGIYVTTAGGVLLFAERSPAGGILMSAIGQTYSYTPKYTYHSEF